MGAVTYSDEKVDGHIANEFIPLRQPPDGKTADAYHLRWTPTLLALDDTGFEHHRLVGFLRPDHFLPALILMKAKVRFAHARFDESLFLFDQIIEDYPDSFSAPEAIYLGAVSLYRIEKDARILKEAWQDMKARFPDSEWAQRMWPYSLL
jgi:hypothetical protein